MITTFKYLLVVCIVRAISACDPIEFASVVEIVPKTCSFWSYSGEIRNAPGVNDPKV